MKAPRLFRCLGWTRGLRSDGTWSSHSPYGTDGGHIVFLGGNVTYFRDVKDALHRFDGKGMTSNIFEALPPGTRIGEYTPDEAEARSWAKRRKWMKTRAAMRPLAGPAVWALALTVSIVQVARER